MIFEGKSLFNKEHQKDIYASLENILLINFPTICFLQIVTEITSKNKIRYHAIIAIRNFIDYNYILKKNLITIINRDLIKDTEYGGKFNYEIDVKVDFLLYFKDIKSWIVYLYKDMYKWKWESNIYIFNSFLEYDIILFSYETENIEKSNLMFKLLNEFDALNMDTNLGINLNILFFKEISHILYNNLKNIKGIRLIYNKIDQRTLINLLQYYLILNNYYIYKDNIYTKIKNSLISYKLIGSVTDVLYNKFNENVISYYISNLEYYFKSLDFGYLLDTFFIKSKNIIENIKDISTQRIEPNFSLIEFSDGIYSIKYDRFFSKNKFSNINIKMCTIKYYDKTYNSTRRLKPINWINGLKNTLGIINNELDNENYLNICLYLIDIFHKNIFNKKSALFIYGKNNTGKTSLIVNLLFNYFGVENICNGVSGSNFNYQYLVGKMVAIMYESQYNRDISGDLLKVMFRESIVISGKYSNNSINIKHLPLIIISNEIFKSGYSPINDILNGRILEIEFTKSVNLVKEGKCSFLKNLLKEEESNIIVYCNKLYFGLNKSKRYGNKFSNNNIMRLIEDEFK
jgi:hypothetical protein